ncbi:MAG: zinc-ribbon domain containing protein [Chloroflexota bacterium]|nr:zinc-ribbon domain containing protein [Chloroflexota bacterium]
MTRIPARISKRGGYLLSFKDKSIQCSDFGAVFTFGAEEQELLQFGGYTNKPKRCP